MNNKIIVHYECLALLYSCGYLTNSSLPMIGWLDSAHRSRLTELPPSTYMLDQDVRLLITMEIDQGVRLPVQPTNCR